jgi:hypothetical protein
MTEQEQLLKQVLHRMYHTRWVDSLNAARVLGKWELVSRYAFDQHGYPYAMRCEDLSTLPHEHPLRNMKLCLFAEYRPKDKKTWTHITPSWGIARATYNQLSGPWLEYDVFRVRHT